MTLLRLAGFSSIRVTSQWLPGQVAPTESELAILRNVAAAAQLSGVRVYLSVYPPGSRSTPLTPEAREEFAAYLTVARAAAAVDRRRDRRQRAEPQPLLAAAVQPGRHRTRPRLRTSRSSHAPTTRSRRSTRGRASGAARSRRAASTGPERAATRTRPSRSSRTWAPPTGRAAARCPSWTGSPSTPTPTRRASRPDTPHPKSTTIGLADYDRLIQTLADAFDGTPQSGQRRCRSSTTSSASSRQIPAGKAKALHGRRARDDEARRRDHPGPVLRAGAAARVLPAERRRDPAASTHRTSRPSRAGSPASTTPTGRRRRASTPSATRSRAPVAARSRAVTGLALDVTATRVRFPTAGRARARLARGPVPLLARLRLGAARYRVPRPATRAHARDGVRARRRAARRVAEGTQARSRDRSCSR